MTLSNLAQTPCLRRPALMWWPISFTPRTLRLPPDLTRAQLQDAGIPLDQARSGPGAAVQGVTIAILDAQR